MSQPRVRLCRRVRVTTQTKTNKKQQSPHCDCLLLSPRSGQWQGSASLPGPPGSAVLDTEPLVRVPDSGRRYSSSLDSSGSVIRLWQGLPVPRSVCPMMLQRLDWGPSCAVAGTRNRSSESSVPPCDNCTAIGIGAGDSSWSLTLCCSFHFRIVSVYFEHGNTT